MSRKILHILPEWGFWGEESSILLFYGLNRPVAAEWS
jgi:hypothetical protein